MKLIKYYKDAVLIPSLSVIVTYIIFAIFHKIFSQVYESEWLTDEAILLTSFWLVILNALLISVLSVTIFLNKYNEIKANFFLSLLSWFVIPMIWILYILITHFHYVKAYSHYFNSENIFVFFNTLPYILGLLLAFIKFRRKI